MTVPYESLNDQYQIQNLYYLFGVNDKTLISKLVTSGNEYVAVIRLVLLHVITLKKYMHLIQSSNYLYITN